AAPNSADGSAGLGELDFQAGRISRAIGYLERAFKEDPHDSAAGEFLARARIRRGEYVQAQQTLQELIRFRPDDPSAHYLLARTLLKVGKSDESALEMKKYQALMSARGPSDQ
ncbi:MAG TPA: tetratricopeptide repeat protein, partial [Terriglobia bacterium]|nr:tetratricopeptide repeat protein [Terriglobia bacterium]